jgi:ParB/RepB/Spo0J family partition protein
MRTIERREIELADIQLHPENREFETRGAEWDHFEDDIGANGIEVDLVVRLLPDGGYQCLEGHRRLTAGMQRNIPAAWCIVKDATDAEAVRAVWRGNMHRENLTAYDEACGVRALVRSAGMTPAEVAAEWNRAVEWVRTRQRMLELGDEVLEAVRRPGRDRLTMGAVEEILKVPDELRAEAVQLVLHPVFQLEALSEDQARDVIQKCLMEPREREAAWEGKRQKLMKSWRKQLEALCTGGKKDPLEVQARPLKEAEGYVRGYEEAERVLTLEMLMPDAPHGLRWLHLAVRHQLAVQVVPVPGDAVETRAVVNTALLIDAEAALAEHGGGNWLVGKKKRIADSRSGIGDEEDEDARRVEKAKADVAAGFDTGVDVSGKAETVIEQHVTRAVMVDVTEVRNVALWAVSADADPMNAPDWVPKWACKLGVEGLWTEIDAITEWVMKLRI